MIFGTQEDLFPLGSLDGDPNLRVAPLECGQGDPLSLEQIQARRDAIRAARLKRERLERVSRRTRPDYTSLWLALLALICMWCSWMGIHALEARRVADLSTWKAGE